MISLKLYVTAVFVGIIIMVILAACVVHEPKIKVKHIDLENIKERYD